jgi:hypothetical protein
MAWGMRVCGARVRSRTRAAATTTTKQLTTRSSPLSAPKQNRRNHPERLELKKYNPYLKRYTLHREIK